MNVLVIGGTGFVGYHAVQEFLRRGHKVTVLALPPMPTDDLLPPDVNIRLADLNELPDEDVRALLQGQDALVYAAGADDRVVPKAPAYEFFFNANVKPSIRLFTLAREAGVKRGVLISSYFAYFDRIWPEMRLSDHHPYVRSRREQEQGALDAATPDLELMILELPYIFGSIPGRTPLWAPLIDYIRSPFPLFYPKGGTNMVSVKNVGEAIVGAIEQGVGGERYVIGDENLTWTDLLGRLSLLVGRRKRVFSIPTFVVGALMRVVRFYHRLQGREGGLDPVEFTKIQTINTFFDPTPSREALAYGQGGLEEALRETVRACSPARR